MREASPRTGRHQGRNWLGLGPSPFKLAVFKRTWHCFERDRIPLVAAGATFFIVLAVFPTFASIVTLFGLFWDRAEIAQQIYRVSAFLPRGGVATMSSELQRLSSQPPQAIGLAWAASSLIALWSASGGVKAIMEGLDVAYEVRETRGFLKFSLSALFIALLGIFVAVVSLGVAVILPSLFAYAPYQSALEKWVTIAAWPGAFLLSLLVLSLVYRFGPNRQHYWRWFSWGAVLASALWLAGTVLFKYYVSNYGSFDRVYGGVGALIGFMVWTWLSLLVLLLGAELNREIERQSSSDSIKNNGPRPSLPKLLQ